MPTVPRPQSPRPGKIAPYLLIAVTLVAASLAAFAFLGSSARQSFSSRYSSNTKPVLDSPSGRAPGNTPLFSDDWTDDSGYGLALRYTLPIKDPTSLEEIRAANAGRAQRGIAELRNELAAVDRYSPAGRIQAFQLSVFLGLLHMNDGQYFEADKRFAEAQEADPNTPSELLANLEALRGVAALRRGESENCVACCNESSCLFPLAPSAVHKIPSGSLDAVKHFNSYLAQRPQDLGVRWLLNVAHMTLGTYPDGLSPADRISLDPFQSPSSIGRFPNVAGPAGLNVRPENMAGGTIVDDFNGDGLLDVFHSNIDPTQGCSLFLNQCKGAFADHSTSAGLDPQIGAENCVHADYDNDGDLDVLLLRGAWESPLRPSLLRNDGHAVFTDVTLEAGLISPIASETAGWADIDGDGDLDLYIAGEYRPFNPDPRNLGKLYRNNADGTFTDIAAPAGVTNERFCRGVAWGDYDNDGRPDLYLSNMGQENRLYHNNGDNTFTDLADSLGVTEPIGSYSCWFWDYDNDGRLDLFVAGSTASLSQVVKSHLGQPTKGERPRLYHNDGDRFTDVARKSGLDRVWLPMGSNYGDIDNDGYLDFYLGTGAPPYSFLMPNVLMHNLAGKRFEDVTVSSGTGHLQKGHGIAFADYDRDGDLDLFLESGGAAPGDKAHNSLFQNPGNKNHWITLKLIGTKSNRSALGARLRLDLSTPSGPLTLHREISPGSSFGNNPLTPTLGLAQATSIDTLEIRWPGSGAIQILKNLPLDASLEITESAPDFRMLKTR